MRNFTILRYQATGIRSLTQSHGIIETNVFEITITITVREFQFTYHKFNFYKTFQN